MGDIFPVLDQLIQRQEKERFLGQRAKVIWLTGLPCSGKTTLAVALEHDLFRRGFLCQVLDGDNVRAGINNNLGFSSADRTENIRRIAEVSKLFIGNGIITINAFVSPTNELRDLARKIIGAQDYLEIFLNPSVETCERRDVKGMYQKARMGEITDFTGVNAPFEASLHADLELRTDTLSVEDCLGNMLEMIIPKIEYRG
jgi:adenylylsulfate kinase